MTLLERHKLKDLLERKAEGLFILGFGGHARSVADVALASGISDIIFFDDNARENETFAGFAVKNGLPLSLPAGWACMPASGDNHKRKTQIAMAEQAGWAIATLISPTSSIGIGAYIGAGSFIGQHAHIGPMASVGKGCIINTGAAVEHECKVGRYAHISVNATVAGRSTVGDFCFVGAGATIIDGIAVCDDVVLGAGSTAIENISHPGNYVGVPARYKQKRTA